MIAKGIVSAIDIARNTVTVILPEYDVVTTPLKVYGNQGLSNLKVNDFVVVIFFNDNFSDGLVFVSAADLMNGIDIIDHLNSESSVDGLSARQGNVLHEMILNTQKDLSDEAITNIELEEILQ